VRELVSGTPVRLVRMTWMTSPLGSPPRIVESRALPPQPPITGDGRLYRIGGGASVSSLDWQLDLIDVRGHHLTFDVPPGGESHLLGLAGPQVSVEAAATHRLRRGSAYRTTSSRITLVRPKRIRQSASRVLCLTYLPGRVEAELSSAVLDGSPVLDDDIAAIVLADGELTAGGSRLRRYDAVLPEAGSAASLTADRASVVLLSVRHVGR